MREAHGGGPFRGSHRPTKIALSGPSARSSSGRAKNRSPRVAVAVEDRASRVGCLARGTSASSTRTERGGRLPTRTRAPRVRSPVDPMACECPCGGGRPSAAASRATTSTAWAVWVFGTSRRHGIPSADAARDVRRVARGQQCTRSTARPIRRRRGGYAKVVIAIRPLDPERAVGNHGVDRPTVSPPRSRWAEARPRGSCSRASRPRRYSAVSRTWCHAVTPMPGLPIRSGKL